MAVSTARQAVLRVGIEESVSCVARNMADSVNEDLVLVAFSTVIRGWAVALEAASVARQTFSVIGQEPIVFTIGTLIAFWASAVQTGLRARRTQIGVVFSREQVVQAVTIFTDVFRAASSGTVAVTIAGTRDVFLLGVHEFFVDAFFFLALTGFQEESSLTSQTVLLRAFGTGQAGFVARQAVSVHFVVSVFEIAEFNAFAVLHHIASGASLAVFVGNTRTSGAGLVAIEAYSVDEDFAFFFLTIVRRNNAGSADQLQGSLAR